MDYIEYGFSLLFANKKGRDAGLISKGAAFISHPKPTMLLECLEIGPSGSRMSKEHSADGAGRFPTLRWSAAPPKTKQYLLLSEDPDAPLPKPIIHGIYYGISPDVSEVSQDDLIEASGPYSLKSGFQYGKNRNTNVYIPPKPLLGHGDHRYFFTIVALGQPIDKSKLSPLATAEEILREINGNVLGWGEWIGVYERKWPRE